MTGLKALNILGLDKLQIIVDVIGKINSDYSDVNALLVYILESAMQLVECESSSILLVDKKSDILRFSVALGPKGSEIMDIPVKYDSLAGWVVKNNHSVIVNDCANDRRFSSDVQRLSGYITNNLIAIPMRNDDDCLGVIELLNKKDNTPFDENDLLVLEFLGSQASVA